VPPQRPASALGLGLAARQSEAAVLVADAALAFNCLQGKCVNNAVSVLPSDKHTATRLPLDTDTAVAEEYSMGHG
jgi:hypothetical protein